jgi:hypothetical protein
MLKWLGESTGFKTAPAQGQPPQSRQQATQQTYAPPISNAVRQAMALQQRVDSGQASDQERGTYSRWYEIYTQMLKKMDKVQARENASKAVFGSF